MSDVVGVDAEDGTRTFTFTCGRTTFGTPPLTANAPLCGFTSAGHLRKKDAVARGREHTEEHESGEPMREVGDFVASVAAGDFDNKEVESDGNPDD